MHAGGTADGWQFAVSTMQGWRRSQEDAHIDERCVIFNKLVVPRLQDVAERLRGPLHEPAVREALGCLIPEWLHPSLDNARSARVKAAAERVGVHLSANRWKVDVCAEAALRNGRPVTWQLLEFFLIVLRKLCEAVCPKVYVGTSTMFSPPAM